MKNDELEQLYRKYYRELYLYAFSLCHDHHVSQEIVSDTFFKAFLSLEEGGINIKYWLLRVCKNLAMDYFRKAKRRADIPVDELKFALTDDVLEKFIADENSRRLYVAIVGLPENLREVVVMFYFLDISTQGISQSLGITDGAVRTLLYRARNKLRELMKEE